MAIHRMLSSGIYIQSSWGGRSQRWFLHTSNKPLLTHAFNAEKRSSLLFAKTFGGLFALPPGRAFSEGLSEALRSLQKERCATFSVPAQGVRPTAPKLHLKGHMFCCILWFCLCGFKEQFSDLNIYHLIEVWTVSGHKLEAKGDWERTLSSILMNYLRWSDR